MGFLAAQSNPFEMSFDQYATSLLTSFSAVDVGDDLLADDAMGFAVFPEQDRGLTSFGYSEQPGFGLAEFAEREEPWQAMGLWRYWSWGMMHRHEQKRPNHYVYRGQARGRELDLDYGVISDLDRRNFPLPIPTHNVRIDLDAPGLNRGENTPDDVSSIDVRSKTSSLVLPEMHGRPYVTLQDGQAVLPRGFDWRRDVRVTDTRLVATHSSLTTAFRIERSVHGLDEDAWENRVVFYKASERRPAIVKVAMKGAAVLVTGFDFIEGSFLNPDRPKMIKLARQLFQQI